MKAIYMYSICKLIELSLLGIINEASRSLLFAVVHATSRECAICLASARSMHGSQSLNSQHLSILPRKRLQNPSRQEVAGNHKRDTQSVDNLEQFICQSSCFTFKLV